MPGPPFRRPYYYFRWDATRDIENNRPTWTEEEAKKTVEAIWAGDATVKTHYANSANQNPGPQLPAPNPIPAQPYTAADAANAKNGNGLPARAPVVVQEEESESSEGRQNASENQVEESDTENNIQVEGSDTDNNVQPEAYDLPAPTAMANSADKLPYDFWPKLPWTPMPDLPTMNAQASNNMKKMNAWIATKPYRTMDGENSWVGAMFLGVGGCGAAGLWVEVDAEKNIRDTMVVKDVKFYDPRHWRDPRNWRNLLPKELENHRLVEERRQVEADMCRYLVHCRGHRLFMAQRRYRVYLDYYNAGALYQPLKLHLEEGRGVALIPEPFIWYMLKALSSACLVLQTGTIASEPVPDWKLINHMDIQLTNIFLQTTKRKRDNESEGLDKSPTRTSSPSKRLKVPPPTKIGVEKLVGKEGESTEWSSADWDNVSVKAVLADFDSAFYSLDSDNCPLSDNPEDYLFHTDHTRYAPEQQRQRGPPWIRFNEKTDVWGIGGVIYMLILNRVLDDGPVREDGTSQEIPLSSHRHSANMETHNMFTVLSGTSFQESDNYSRELRDLVSSCLEWNQDNRPSLRKLLETADLQLRRPGAKQELMDWEGFNLPRHAGLFEIGAPAQNIRRAMDADDG